MIILGPIETFSLLRRSGIPSARVPAEMHSHVYDRSRLLPLPKLITNQTRVLGTAPSLRKSTSAQLDRLKIGNASDASNRQDVVVAFVNSKNLRRYNKHLRTILIGNPLPSKSILRVDNDVHILCPALCLIALAKCNEVSDEELAFAAFELCSRYAYSDDAQRELISITPLTSVEHILDYLDEIRGLGSQAPNGLNRLKRVLPYVQNGARSPFEIASSMFMGWPVECGGLGVPRFETNHQIHLDARERMELGKRYLEVDFMWPEYHTVLEYDGDVHNYQRDSDSARINVLRDKGNVVEILTKQILKHHESYIKLMKRLEEPLGFKIAMNANARIRRISFQQHVIDIAEHRSALRI